MKYKGLMFDLDETLTPSKRPMEPDMLETFSRLIAQVPVAITSGASLSQIRLQVLDSLPQDSLKNVYVFPTGGAAMYEWRESNWNNVYEHLIEEAEAKRVMTVINQAIDESEICKAEPAWGDRVEWRGSQITFSGLGQKAPYDAKAIWDADKHKRLGLREILLPKLPDYDVVLGGTTSVDIIPKGINKAYGLRKFAEKISADDKEILYFGDDLREGGNDYVIATLTEADTSLVNSPQDTLVLIKELMNQ